MFIQHKSGQNPVSTHRQCYWRFCTGNTGTQIQSLFNHLP